MKIKKRIDSFSSDDELPLTSLTESGAEEPNSYKSLCRQNVESCEFCDKVFRNRYNSLIHNATHIIIPLINQNVIRCKECLFYFTSPEEYQTHILKKHPLTNGSIQPQEKREAPIKTRNRLKFEDDDCLNYTSEILKCLTTECKVKLNFIEQPLVPTVSKDSIVTDDSDDDSDILINKYIFGVVPDGDQSKQCNSSVDAVFNNVEVNGVSDKVNGAIGSCESVHCDVLKKPKCVWCRHCKKKFPDRYSLVIHETSHMDVDKRLPHLCTTCDWYIAGNSSDLKRHKKTHIPYNVKPGYKPLKHCTHCGLKYQTLVRHANNYHQNWKEEEKYEKIIHVCDLCYEFLKSRTDRYYTKQGTISEVGKRYTCNQCMRMFFDLNIVRTRLVLHNWGLEKKIKKKLTNKQRLDKIQNRLLQMNKMGKF